MARENVVYLDKLDTVRTGVEQDINRRETNMVFGKDTLMQSLLLFQTPILSQTQLIDSKIIIDNLEEPYFKKCLENGYIQTSWHGKMESDPGILNSYLSLLDKGIDGKTESELFRFSSFNCFNQGSLSDKKNIRAKCKEYAINLQKGNSVHGLQGWMDNENCERDQLERFIHHLVELDSANLSRYRKRAATEKQSKPLHERLLDLVSSEQEKQTVANIIDTLNQDKDSRTAYYHLIDDSNLFDKQKYKGIVDREYNIIVGESLAPYTESTIVESGHAFLKEPFFKSRQEIENAQLLEKSKLESLYWKDIFEAKKFLIERSSDIKTSDDLETILRDYFGIFESKFKLIAMNKNRLHLKMRRSITAYDLKIIVSFLIQLSVHLLMAKVNMPIETLNFTISSSINQIIEKGAQQLYKNFANPIDTYIAQGKLLDFLSQNANSLFRNIQKMGNPPYHLS